MLSQYDSITKVPGIGPKYAQLLEELNIFTLGDLLNHIPFRYEDRTQVKKISELTPEIETSVLAQVEKISNVFTKRGFRLTKATVSDETGKMDVVWFNQTFITKTLKPGMAVLLFGKAIFEGKRPQFNSPEWEIQDESDTENISKIVPVYATTEGITSKWIKKRIAEVINTAAIDEYLPLDFIKNHNFLDRETSLKLIHQPKDFIDLDKAKRRLAFDELLIIHMDGLKTRHDWENKKNGHIIKISKEKLNTYLSKSPFELTNAQTRSISEILESLSRKSPMNRLLQGDVGSGKTAVAEAAIFACLNSGYTVIFMAPTQILAKQHFEKIMPKLSEFGFQTDLLTSDTKVKNTVTKNKPKLVIATHAILHNLDGFENVGLIIIDEQHKFGVEQRSKVIEHYTKNEIVPNLLTMTATPIPRSFALTLYGDLDLSIIDELPPFRKKTTTWVLKPEKRLSAYKWMLGEIENKHNQVFVVCPFIQESIVETFKDVKAAEVEFEKLVKTFPPRIKIDLLHGKTKDKEDVIQRFRVGETQILVATPVIEVGVDIPAANIMIIENPERFGLASLHQLRGRVGRGNEQGYCLLFLSDTSPESSSRIKYLETVQDGAKLAEIDMKLRGPGNIYGTRQHGYLYLKIADLSDVAFIKETKEFAQELFVNREKYPKIMELLSAKSYIDDQ